MVFKNKEHLYFSIYEIVSLTVFGSILRFYRIGFHSFWLDEILSIRDASVPFSKISSTVLASPPLFHYLLRALYLLVGRNDFWLRILPAFFGIITVPIIYWVAWKLWGEKAAFWSALLMAVSVFDILYSQELRMYSMLSLETLLSIYFWINAIDTGVKHYWFYYGFLTLIGLYTHNWFPFLVLAQAVWWLGISIRQSSFDRFGLYAFIMIGFSYIPWLFVLRRQLSYPVYGHMGIPGWGAIRETFYAFAGIRVPSGESWVGIGADARTPLLLISLGFLIFGLLFEDGKRYLAIRVFCVGLFMPLAIAFLISVYIKPIYLPGRYPIMCLPVYILIVARGFQNVSDSWRNKATFLGILWISASLFTLGRYYWYYEKSSWKKACQWIANQELSPEPLYVNLHAQYAAYFTDYYLASRTRNSELPLENKKDKSSYFFIEEGSSQPAPSLIPSNRHIINEVHFAHLSVYQTQ